MSRVWWVQPNNDISLTELNSRAFGNEAVRLRDPKKLKRLFESNRISDVKAEEGCWYVGNHSGDEFHKIEAVAPHTGGDEPGGYESITKVTSHGITTEKGTYIPLFPVPTRNGACLAVSWAVILAWALDLDAIQGLPFMVVGSFLVVRGGRCGILGLVAAAVGALVLAGHRGEAAVTPLLQAALSMAVFAGPEGRAVATLVPPPESHVLRKRSLPRCATCTTSDLAWQRAGFLLGEEGGFNGGGGSRSGCGACCSVLGCTDAYLWWEDVGELQRKHDDLQGCCARYVPWWLAHSLAAAFAYALAAQTDRFWLAANATLLQLGLCLGAGFLACPKGFPRPLLCMAVGCASLALHLYAVALDGAVSLQGGMAAGGCLLAAIVHYFFEDKCAPTETPEGLELAVKPDGLLRDLGQLPLQHVAVLWGEEPANANNGTCTISLPGSDVFISDTPLAEGAPPQFV